jgi:hypothetical protein
MLLQDLAQAACLEEKKIDGEGFGFGAGGAAGRQSFWAMRVNACGTRELSPCSLMSYALQH